MRLGRNSGTDRVDDGLRASLSADLSRGIASAGMPPFQFAEIRSLLEKLGSCQIVFPAVEQDDPDLAGAGGILECHRELAPADAANRSNLAAILDQHRPENGRRS